MVYFKFFIYQTKFILHLYVTWQRAPICWFTPQKPMAACNGPQARSYTLNIGFQCRCQEPKYLSDTTACQGLHQEVGVLNPSTQTWHPTQ